jgi:acyl-CoA synthetase (AMP-forming)/AMP-acid ligase II
VGLKEEEEQLTVVVSLGSNQIHVPAAVLLRDPLQFIKLLDTHGVAYTFAPNFFLAKLQIALAAKPHFTADLCKLEALISGGESNVVETCHALTLELARLGAKGQVIRPGFGMTETCAGSIYSCACPSYDLARGHEFASLGTCIPGMAMRVVSLTDAGKLVQTGETGALQVSGPVVFEEYYNDAKATHDAFTADGWFITGDLARIDATGRLHLTGRTKDSIIINGIKWSSTELEKTIEQENIPGLRPSFTAVFPTRAPNQPTEQLAVVYSPAFEIDDDRVRYETARAINKILSLAIGSTAAQVVPLDPVMLHKSSLFKLSRTKLRAALERGDFATYVEDNCRRIEAHAQSCRRAPESATEAIVQRDLAVLLGISLDEISTEASIFELGICSFNLILLKATIQMSLGTKVDIPMSVMLKE